MALWKEVRTAGRTAEKICLRRRTATRPATADGCGLAVAALPSTAKGQSATEVIRGRILSADSLPVPQAEVMVTGLATRVSQTLRTDSKGYYTTIFTNPEGDYLVAVRKVGYLSTTVRL